MRTLDAAVVELIRMLDAREREDLFGLIRENWCISCGRELTIDHPVCHCENDE